MRGHDESAEGRGEGERVDERYTYSHSHRKSELGVECTCRSAHEAYRDEYCLAAMLYILTNHVKATKKLHPIVFIAASAVIGVVFRFGAY